MAGAIAPTFLAENADAGTKSSYAHLAGLLPVAGLGYGLVVDNAAVSSSTDPGAVPIPVDTTGLAWIQVATITFGTAPIRRKTLFVASKPSGLTTGAITVEYRVAGVLTAQAYSIAKLYAFPGADAGVDGANLLGQLAVAGDSGGALVGSQQLSLPDAFGNANNVTWSTWASHRASLLVPHADLPAHALLHHTYLGGGKNTDSMEMWYDGEDLTSKVQVRTADGTADYTAKVAGIVVELVAAGAEAPPSAEPVVVNEWTYSSTGTGSPAGTYANFGPAGASWLDPANGPGYLCTVYSGVNSAGPSAIPTLTGWGMTWVLQETVEQPITAPLRRVSVFRARVDSGATPGLGTLDFAGQGQFHVLAVMDRVDNPNTSGTNGSGMVVQGDTGQTGNTAAASATATLGLALEADTVVWAAFGVAVNGLMRPDPVAPVWTELTEVTVAAGKNATLGTYWYPGADLTAKALIHDVSDVATTGKWGWVTLELRGGVGAPEVLDDADALALDDDGLAIAVDDEQVLELITEATLRILSPVVLPPGESVSATVDLVVEVRGPDLVLVGQVTKFDSLHLVLRHQDVSTWALTVGSDEPLAGALATPGYGIVVKRKGRVIFSGPMRAWEWNLAEGDPDGPPPDLTLTVGGPDDTIVLADRVASPVPTAEVAPYDAQEADIRQGAGETLIYGYAASNAGAGAVASRVMLGLAMSIDLGRGQPESPGQPALIARGRWQTVLELCQEVARSTAEDLGFRVRQIGPVLQFQVYEPADLVDEVVFSQELGNLVGFRYAGQAPQATHVYVAGQGEGAAREVVEDDNAAASATWGARIERFVDRRDVDNTAELRQAASASLAELGAQVGLQLATIDTPRLRYGDQFDCGDRVRVIVGGVAIVDVLRQVALDYVASESEPAELVTPTVGSDTGVTLPQDQELRVLRRNVSRLNRS